MDSDDGEEGVMVHKWRLLGFDSEDISNEFAEVGVLGLDCLVGTEFDPMNGTHGLICPL